MKMRIKRILLEKTPLFELAHRCVVWTRDWLISTAASTYSDFKPSPPFSGRTKRSGGTSSTRISTKSTSLGMKRGVPEHKVLTHQTCLSAVEQRLNMVSLCMLASLRQAVRDCLH